MKKLTETLKKEDGASLVAAILFFVLCGVGASVILASASASAGKMQQVPAADQKRFAVESAAAFLRDELTRKENIVKIKEVRIVTEDSSGTDIEDTLNYYYVGQQKKENQEASWVEFSSTNPSVLDEMIRYFDDTLEDREGDTAVPDKTDQEVTIPLSVEKSRGTETVSLGALKTSVQLTMDPDYRITAVISDTSTDEDHPEDLCQRKLTVPAQKQEDIDVEVVEHEETNEDGSVDSWTKTTTTRLTTIRWERGTIEKIHPEEGT